MRPEGEGWITAREAGRILNMSPSWVKQRTREGRWQHHTLAGRTGYYQETEIMAVAQTAEHQRRLAMRQEVIKRREGYCPPKPVRRVQKVALANGLISSGQACALLGVTRQRLSLLVRTGKLSCVQNYPGQVGSPAWVWKEEVEGLRVERAVEAQQKKEQAERTKPAYAETPVLRTPERFRRVDFQHLPLRDRYFGEWLTTRQVAWMLGVTLCSVYAHLRRGHFQAVREGKPGRNGANWLFLKKDVVTLLHSDRYSARRALWHRLFTEEGKAQRAAERSDREWQIIHRLNRENRGFALHDLEPKIW